MQDGPIFIIGAMGSGTTLLRLLLDSHSRIAIPHETGFMRGYDAHRFTPFKWSGRNWFKRLGWTVAEYDALMSEHYRRVFMRYAEDHGKERWGEKTPLHTWHVDDMARLFPDAVFVGMIRHPLGSVGSNVGRWGTPIARGRRHWQRYAREIARQAANHPDRFALLRYEDLVLHPETVMRELLDWLGEPWDDAVLEHHEVQSQRTRRRRRVEGQTRVDDPIDVSRIDKWQRSTLTPGAQRWLGRRLRAMGAFYGYDVADPRPREPLGADGALVAPGAAIAERIARFPELELTVQGEVPRHDQPYDPRNRVLLTKDEYNELARPRGVRRVGVWVVRQLPEGRARRAVVRPLQQIRRRLGLPASMRRRD